MLQVDFGEHPFYEVGCIELEPRGAPGRSARFYGLQKATRVHCLSVKTTMKGLIRWDLARYRSRY